MQGQRNTKPLYFEDFEEGRIYRYQVPGLTPDAIKAFAAEYDPQRFHLDEEAAARTHFGRLAASGFQTQLMCFGPFCRDVLLDTHAVGAPGIDNLKWLRPWFPGDTLDVEVTLVDKRVSSKRNDRGYLSFALKASVDDKPTLSMEWVVIMLTRQGSAINASTVLAPERA